MTCLGSWLLAGVLWFLSDVLKCFWKDKQERKWLLECERGALRYFVRGMSPPASGGCEDLRVEKQQRRARNKMACKHQINLKNIVQVSPVLGQGQLQGSQFAGVSAEADWGMLQAPDFKSHTWLVRGRTL